MVAPSIRGNMLYCIFTIHEAMAVSCDTQVAVTAIIEIRHRKFDFGR